MGIHAPILIVSPQFPPARGGLPDHTLRLAQILSEQNDVTVLTSAGAGTEKGFNVLPEITDWQDTQTLLAAIEKSSLRGPILWQYVPHMYGRGGVNPGLPKVIAALKQQRPRQLVIAHEIAAGFSLWPQRCWYALAHRRQWRKIMACMDVIAFSTEAWLEEWSRSVLQPRPQWCLLPSPSSIPVASVPDDHPERWREEHGLPRAIPLLLYFGTLSGAKQFDWVLDAWLAVRIKDKPVGLVVVGDQPGIAVAPEFERLFRPLGYLAPTETSRALQAADVVLLPFSDGVSERRTSFMTGLSHGRAVLTTYGHNTGSTLRRAAFFQAANAGDKEAFITKTQTLLADRGERLRLGTAGRNAYEMEYDWPVIGRKLNEQLRRLGP